MFLLLFILIELLSSGEEYYVSSNSTTWGNEACTMASPELIFTKDGMRVDVSAIPAEPSWNELWIGYFQHFVTYTFLGNYFIIFNLSITL